MTGCTGLFFHPSRDLVRTPSSLGLAWRDVWFEGEDGTRLHGWFLPAEGAAEGSVLFAHGNAQNVSTHVGGVAWMPKAGFNVLAFDYRGYGRSEGRAELAGLHGDTRAAFEALARQPEVDPGRIAVYGGSLGGSVASVALAGEASRVRGLVIEGAFSGYRAIAAEKLRLLVLTRPLANLLARTIDDRFRPLEAMPRWSPTPVLILHAPLDRIVPIHHGEALFRAAREPKAMLSVPGGHLQAMAFPDWQEQVRRFLADCAFADQPRCPSPARPRH